MNKRIKEIALQVGGSHYPEVNPILLEKFAEFIIRECADIAKKAEPFQTYDLILKNFGLFEERK